MVRVVRGLEDLRFLDERNYREVLDAEPHETSEGAGQNGNESQSAKFRHFASMAGKTGGVARVVSRRMRPGEIGKAEAVDNGNSHQNEGEGRPWDSWGFGSVVFFSGGCQILHRVPSDVRGYSI
jgi:hypothetical protein